MFVIIYYIYNFLYIIVFRIAYMPFGAIVLTLRYGCFWGCFCVLLMGGRWNDGDWMGIGWGLDGD